MASLFSKPKAPKEKPPVVMPDMEDPSVRAAGQKRMADMSNSSGRSATLLNSNFGGDSYGSGGTTRFGG